MATEKRTQQPTPPKAGTRPSIRVDDQLAADLAVVMRTGVNMSDAIRQAVRQAADIHRTAWAEGVVPVGTAPVLLAYQLQQDPAMRPPRPTPAPAPTSAYDARQQPPTPPVARPAAPAAPPSAPAPRRRFTLRRRGPVEGVPVHRP
ncbi:ribbon-helix-helix domain-containing protein [Streptomyces sp. NPDC086077]|uniref:ribbon-helix-helix domain-containing protein n=1 Tax=Streptomyces sp. NPDC086077 TaxID=3154862 RepID=UPI00343AF7FD